MLAPADLDPAALPRRLRGYDAGQVERLLAGLRAGFEETGAECSALATRLATLEARAAEMAGLERDLRETLLDAQRAVEERRHAAEEEAAALVERARTQAVAAAAGLEVERARAEAEIERLYELERSFRAEARKLVERAFARLGTVEPPEGPVRPEPASVAEAPPRAASELATAPTPSIEDDTLPFVLPAAEASEQEPVPAMPEASIAPPEYQPEAAVAEELAEPVPVRRRSLRPYLLSAGILAVGVLVAVGIWQLASDGAAASPALPAAASGTTSSASPAAETAAAVETAADPAGAGSAGEPAPGTTPARPPVARFALRSEGGDAWVLVRAGSARGKLLFEGFLYDGEERQFARRRLWVRIGDPTHLVAVLNGKRVRTLPAGTADLAVTAAGVRTLSIG